MSLNDFVIWLNNVSFGSSDNILITNNFSMRVDNFKDNINKKCVIKVKVGVENEYIQGILTKVGEKSFTITQIIPYCNLVNNEKFKTLEREILFETKFDFIENFYD